MWKRVTNHVSLFQGFYLRATILRFLHFSWAVTVICLYQDVTEKELTTTNPFGALHVWNQTNFVWKNLGPKPKSFFFLSVLLLCNFHFTLFLQGVRTLLQKRCFQHPWNWSDDKIRHINFKHSLPHSPLPTSPLAPGHQRERLGSTLLSLGSLSKIQLQVSIVKNSMKGPHDNVS
jgi:hypothetical protein